MPQTGNGAVRWRCRTPDPGALHALDALLTAWYTGIYARDGPGLLTALRSERTPAMRRYDSADGSQSWVELLDKQAREPECVRGVMLQNDAPSPGSTSFARRSAVFWFDAKRRTTRWSHPADSHGEVRLKQGRKVGLYELPVHRRIPFRAPHALCCRCRHL